MKRLAFLAIFAVLSVCPLQVFSQEEEIIINSSLYSKHTMPLVKFTHQRHFDNLGYDCTECHHLYKNGKNVWTESDETSCQVCHNEPTVKNEKRLPPPQQKLNLKLSYHGLCIDCHRKYNHKNNTKAAPITCQGCHTIKEGK